MKIESFSGRVDVFGSERCFALVGEELRINKFTTEEASRLLMILERIPATAAPDVELSKVEAPKATEPEKPKRAKAPPVEAPKVEAPKVEAPKVEAPKVEAPKVEAPKPVEPVKAEAPKAPPVEAPKPAGGNGGSNLATAKRLVDVIIALQEQGITETDAIVNECERLRTEVPLLDRIPDMRDRVERALSTLGQ